MSTVTKVKPKEQDEPQGTRGRRLDPQGVGGYDQTWYPICFSSELETGRIVSVEWMNGRVIVIRDTQGKPHALSAFCRHLGADLAGGDVVDGTVRCPYHHWRYDMDGQCVATAIDRAPPAAKLFRFPAHEGYGFVWAFNGTEPLFPPPALDVPEDTLHFAAESLGILPVEHSIAFSNCCDIQHLKAVHGLQLEINPEHVKVTPYSIQYIQDQIAPGLGAMRLHIHLMGSAALSLKNSSTPVPTYLFSAGRPLAGGRHHLYQVAAVPRRPDAPDDAAAAKLAIEQLLAFGRQLVAEDTP